MIVVNLLKTGAQNLLNDIQGYLEDRAEFEIFPVQDNFQPSLLQETDMAITIGGDGTLLYCARILAGEDIPILAVNLGDFGFITEISAGEWKEALEKYQAGLLGISKRILFKAHIERQGREIACFTGLNDAVIRAVGVSKIIRLQLFLSKTYLGRYRADGVILATPTGSTAYSMSAGGPILHPEMEAFIINPICPFTLSNRPIVVPGGEQIEILVEENQRTGIMLVIDGQNAFQLLPLDRLHFRKANKYSLIVLSDRRNFYEVLRSKLNWAGEPHA